MMVLGIEYRKDDVETVKGWGKARIDGLPGDFQAYFRPGTDRMIYLIFKEKIIPVPNKTPEQILKICQERIQQDEDE